MSEALSQMLKDHTFELPWFQMGSSFLIGLSIGFMLKKSFKILLFLGGLSIALLFVLEHQHIITINEVGIAQSVSQWYRLFEQFALFLKERLSHLGVAGGGSSVAGFIAGFKMG